MAKYTAKKGYEVLQLTKQGEEVARYASATDAINQTGFTGIYDVLAGRLKSAGGFVFISWEKDKEYVPGSHKPPKRKEKTAPEPLAIPESRKQQIREEIERNYQLLLKNRAELMKQSETMVEEMDL